MFKPEPYQVEMLKQLLAYVQRRSPTRRGRTIEADPEDWGVQNYYSDPYGEAKALVEEAFDWYCYQDRSPPPECVAAVFPTRINAERSEGTATAPFWMAYGRFDNCSP